ncbi:hypothetical protein ACFY8P_33515 [Streptomyces sp. NPDC012693]|uniref:hypothetical protein n=1 Tax=Streptomyces sp. NPDC012693 TaxID=3364844 RepID=UPI0036773F13
MTERTSPRSTAREGLVAHPVPGRSAVRVGVGLPTAAVRDVAFTAMEAATLARIHPGRRCAAVGHGLPTRMRSAGAWPCSP